MTTAPPPPPKPGKPPVNKPNVPSGNQRKEQKTPKKFSVSPLAGNDEGEKIVIYGKSGIGKTTLAAQVPGAVFVPIDDGARKIVNPLTGEPVSAFNGIEDFDDLRAATQQAADLIPKGGAIVIDTVTKVQPLAEAWVVENVPVEKGGKAKNIESFGFGKGYRHTLDAIRNWLTDLDRLIRSGIHVILLSQLDQATVANASGVDYLEDVPKLLENKQGPIRTEVCEWADHIIRIGYLSMAVNKDDESSRVGKARGDSVRAIFTGGALHFMAKSRPISGNRLPPIIGFETEKDNSLWQFVLEGAVAEQEPGE